MAGSEATDGPVLSLMNKRLRALKKKYNRIVQMEEAISQGKPINKEQEEVLRSKPAVLTLIDEYEKLRQPLSTALQEELNLALECHQVSATPVVSTDDDKVEEQEEERKEQVTEKDSPDRDDAVIEDLLNLLYFGSLFDVKPQRDFTSTMLTRNHERGCCLTYDYVTDDATDLLGDRDLDLISKLGSLLISRPAHSSLSHKNALQTCVQHAKLWLSNSNEPIEAEATITYAGLRERLSKILASDYLTITPEMKGPVDVAAAVGKYTPNQVPVENSSMSSPVPVHTEGAFVNYQQKDEEIEDSHGEETATDQFEPVEEFPKDELEMRNEEEDPDQQEQHNSQAEVELKDQQYGPRRTYQNQRGGRGGGRRGYPNGRGGRGNSRGGGGYQNGRNQYFDQPGNYYPRNYYNTRGRGGRGSGGPSYNNHGPTPHNGHGSAAVESVS